MKKKTAIIVNPSADRGRALKHFRAALPEIEAAFSTLEVKMTEGPQHATQLTREAINRGATLIVAVGGDGTVGEVVNGIFDDQKKLLNDDIVLGILPSGSGDDLRRSLGWPKGIRPNIQRLQNGRVRHIDLGLVTSSDGQGGALVRYFVNVASCGVSAGVSQKVRHTSRFVGSTTAYYWESVKSIWRFAPKHIRAEIDGNQVIFPQCSLMAFANGEFFGGGMRIAPQALLDDGLFNLVTVSNLGLWFYLRHGMSVYSGEHIHLPQVTKSHGRSAYIECEDPEPIFIEADGEEAGQLPAKFEILPGSLPVLV